MSYDEQDQQEGRDDGQDDTLAHRRWLEEHPYSSPQAWMAWVRRSEELTKELKQISRDMNETFRKLHEHIDDIFSHRNSL